MGRLAVNLTAAEYRRAQSRNLPSVPEAFGVLVSVDALRNPISVERLQPAGVYRYDNSCKMKD
jgi:hypothetical protein